MVIDPKYDSRANSIVFKPLKKNCEFAFANDCNAVCLEINA